MTLPNQLFQNYCIGLSRKSKLMYFVFLSLSVILSTFLKNESIMFFYEVLKKKSIIFI